jgi:lysozyme family protein
MQAPSSISPRLQQLIDALVQREGGYVNDPDDRGGPTKYGITLATLHDWRQAPVSAADVEALDRGEAARIYADRYFLKPGFDAVRDPLLQEFLFDFAVNSGPGASVAALQSAIGVEPDGVFGPKSRAALDKVTNLPALFFAVKCERYELLLRDVGRWPADAKFAEGWSNRLDQFSEKLA